MREHEDAYHQGGSSSSDQRGSHIALDSSNKRRELKQDSYFSDEDASDQD